MGFKLIPDRNKMTKTLARSAGASYIMNKDLSDKERMEKVREVIRATDFRIVKKLSDSRISTFRYGRVYIIAHRGTAVDTSSKYEDLLADFKLAFKAEATDKNFQIRMARTISIIEIIRKERKDAIIHLTGHSLGGTSAYYCMTKNEFIFDNVSKCVCFNPGTTPLNYTLVFTRRKREFDSKIKLHHIRGDFISKNLNGLHGTKHYYYFQKTFIKRTFGFFAKLNPFTKYFYGAHSTISHHSITNFY